MPRRADGRLPAPAPSGRQRLDKWLVYARAVKSRALAQRLIESGALRVNATRTTATDFPVAAGDVLTMVLQHHIRVWRILSTAERRGPVSEATQLYEDLSPRLPDGAPPDDGGGKPAGGPGRGPRES